MDFRIGWGDGQKGPTNCVVTGLCLVQYLHAFCYSPTKTIWTKAITKNNFKSWPGLIKKLVNKHLPTSKATVQGHIHRKRKNLQSTQEHNNQPHSDDYNFPISPVPDKKINEVVYMLINKDEVCTAYQDLTGRFPARSTRGNKYVLIGYHYDSNCILGTAVENQKAPVLAEAWELLHKHFEKAEISPAEWVMDNEISSDLNTAFEKMIQIFNLSRPTHIDKTW